MKQSLINAGAVSVRWLLIIVLIVLAAAVSVGVLRFERLGNRLLTVQTGSMQPVFRPGDVVIDSRATPGSLRIGDIVSYRSLRDPRVIVSHRIIAISPTDGQITTKGDALHIHDPSISPQLVIGRVKAVAPGLGRLLSWLRSPLGLGLTAYMPALITIALQCRRLVHIYQPTGYRLYGR